MGRLLVVVSVLLYVVTITRHSVAMWGGYLLSVCNIECYNYYQTQCCHMGRLLVVVSVSLYVVTITRHSVAMWGGYCCLCIIVCCTITIHSVAIWGGCLLLCL